MQTKERKFMPLPVRWAMKNRDGNDALHDLVFGMTGRQHISELTSAEATM